MIIYKATNIINSKSYIGKTISEFSQRKNRHKSEAKRGNNNHFYRAIRKYGWESFEWEIICACKNELILSELEKFFIAYYNTYINGYNSSVGGDGPGKNRVPWNKGKKLDKPHRHPSARQCVLIHPEGFEERFKCVKYAGDKYRLNSNHLRATARGERLHHKGYKCKYTDGR